MTTTQKIKAKLAEIEAEAKIADKLVCDLAAGTKKWQMCVTPQDDDTDMMLVKQVRETIPSLLATLSDLVGALEKVAADAAADELPEYQAIAQAALDRAGERLK